MTQQPTQGHGGANPEQGAELQDVIQNVRDKWTLTLINRVHMDGDLKGLDALTALTGLALQADANARANLLQQTLLAHMAVVGFVTAANQFDGAHLAADTTNAPTLNAVPVASSLATSITLTTALRTALAAHAVQAGVHFHNDTATYTLPVTPPVTLADVINDLNYLLTSFLSHFALASF